MGTVGMALRSGAVVGQGVLQQDFRQYFEEGVRLIFTRWTALNLALENEWGGADSKEKAQYLYEDTLEWFYKRKEHYADDLQLELDDGLQQDFNMDAEDGSPAEVAKTAVTLYQQLLQGDMTLFNHLKAHAVSGAAASQRQMVDNDGTVLGTTAAGESSSDDGDDSGGESGDDDHDMMDADVAPQAVQIQKEPQGPIIDDEGFELVQKRKGRR